jgi:transcriptional regulator
VARTDVLQGTLALMVLRTLALGPQHGLGLSQRIEQVTRGSLRVNPGSLFPALRRMEDEGWIVGEWGESENRRRARFYTLTRAGRRRLEQETREWERVCLAMKRVLGTS